MKLLYDCQVWDSVTHEWNRCLVEVELPPGELSHSEVAHALGQRINEAVSVAFDEDPGAWHLRDVHVLNASGEQVVMVQLFSLRDDMSVIMSVLCGASEVPDGTATAQ